MTINLAIILFLLFCFWCVVAYFTPNHWFSDRNVTNATDRELEEIFEDINK